MPIFVGCAAAPVDVEIVAADNDTVIFETDARLTNATNQSPDLDRRVKGRFKAKRVDQIWIPEFPWEGHPLNPIPPDPSVAFTAGATGPLHLNQAAAKQKGTSARGQCFIRGSQPQHLLADENALIFKRPDCL